MLTSTVAPLPFDGKAYPTSGFTDTSPAEYGPASANWVIAPAVRPGGSSTVVFMTAGAYKSTRLMLPASAVSDPGSQVNGRPPFAQDHETPGTMDLVVVRDIAESSKETCRRASLCRPSESRDVCKCAVSFARCLPRKLVFRLKAFYFPLPNPGSVRFCS